jgi:hypothetical protein
MNLSKFLKPSLVSKMSVAYSRSFLQQRDGNRVLRIQRTLEAGQPSDQVCVFEFKEDTGELLETFAIEAFAEKRLFKGAPAAITKKVFDFLPAVVASFPPPDTYILIGIQGDVPTCVFVQIIESENEGKKAVTHAPQEARPLKNVIENILKDFDMSEIETLIKS